MKYTLIAVTEELRNVEREIQKTRKYLFSLENRFQKVRYQGRYAKSQEKTLTRLESEFRRKHPNLPVRRSLLAIVGTEPYNPPSLDKMVTRQIVAERYGR